MSTEVDNGPSAAFVSFLFGALVTVVLGCGSCFLTTDEANQYIRFFIGQHICGLLGWSFMYHLLRYLKP